MYLGDIIILYEISDIMLCAIYNYAICILKYRNHKTPTPTITNNTPNAHNIQNNIIIITQQNIQNQHNYPINTKYQTKLITISTCAKNILKLIINHLHIYNRTYYTVDQYKITIIPVIYLILNNYHNRIQKNQKIHYIYQNKQVNNSWPRYWKSIIRYHR